MKRSQAAMVFLPIALLVAGMALAHETRLIPFGDGWLLPLTFPDEHLRVTPTTLDFGQVQIGSSASRSFTVENPSTQTQSVAVTVRGGEVTVVGEIAFELPAGAAPRAVELVYRPVAEGSLPAEAVTVTATDPRGFPQAADVTLVGSGFVGGPQIGVSPEILAFGETLVNFFSHRELTVRNQSEDRVEVALSWSAASVEIPSTSARFVLGIGEAHVVQPIYGPQTLTDHLSDRLSIAATNATGEHRIEVPMSGTVIEHLATATPASLDFGTVAAGESVTLATVMQNHSAGPVSVRAFLGAGEPLSLGTGDDDFQLAVGASRSVEVTYSPTGVADPDLTHIRFVVENENFMAELVFVQLAGQVAVSGAQLVAFMPFTSPSVTIGELAFGDVVAGAGNTYTFELMVGNVGDTPTTGAGLAPPIDASGCVGPVNNRLCFERRSGADWLPVSTFPQELGVDQSIHLRGVWTPTVEGLSPPLSPVTVTGGVEPLALAVTGASLDGTGAIVQILDAERPDRPVLSDVVLDDADRVGDATLTRRIAVRNIGQADTVGEILGLRAGTACIDDPFLNKCFYAADGGSIVELPLANGEEIDVRLSWFDDPAESTDSLNSVLFTNGTPSEPQSALLRVHTKAGDGQLPENGGGGDPQGVGGNVGAPDEFGGVRGLLNDNLFMSDTALDSINRMNGNLVVTIPLGQPLPVGPSFSYQLTLVHNSNKWVTRSWEDVATPDPLFNGNVFTVPVPGNAGLGWNVSLGGELYVNAVHFGGTNPAQFFPHDWPSRGEESWVYVDASGGSHPIGGLGLDLVSTDGSNIRLSGGPTADTVAVELPSGLVQTFERHDQDCPAVNASGLALCRRLSKVEDRFGNSVSITYSPDATSATVTDSHGREIVVRYRTFEPCDGPCPLGPGAQISTRRVVDEIEFPATGGRRAIWNLITQDRLINRACEVSDGVFTANELRLKVPILDRIRFENENGGVIPESGSYELDYFDIEHAPLLHCKVNAGELVSVETPSKARIEYDYTNVFLPIGCSSRTNSDPPDTSRGRGILERRVLRHDATAAPKSTQRFRYHRTDRANGATVCTRDNTMQTHVVHSPAQIFDDGKEHYRHEVSFHTLTQTEDNLPPGGDWRLRDYGLPITKNLSHSIVGAFDERLYLSSLVLDCDHDGTIINDITDPEASGCELHRRTYRAYAYKTLPENCDSPAGRFLGCRTLARPLLGMRELHGDQWIETGWSEYDGYSTFRTATTKSDFTGSTRTTAELSNTFVWVNGSPTFHQVAVGPDSTLADWLPDRQVVEPWLLGLFDRKESNPDGGVRKTTFEYDQRGFLQCQRSYAVFGSAAPEQNRDVTVRYVDENSPGNPPDGRPDLEEWAGGDEGNAGASPGCSGVTEYALRHTYDRGQLATSQFLDAAGGAVGPPLADNAFDAATGLVSQSCDHSVGSPPLCVAFDYDRLGRKTADDPVDGRGIHRDFVYQLDAFGGGTVTVTSRDETAGNLLVAEAELTLDEFGRDSKVRHRISEARKDPRNSSVGNQWIRQSKLYHDDNDQVSVVTGVFDEVIWNGMHPDSRAATRYKFRDYDIHGRLLEFESPKGETVNFTFFGGGSNLRVQRLPFQGGSVRNRWKLDHLGRTVKLWEGMFPTGDPASAERVTDFTYSIGVETAIRSDGGVTQKRKRFLDGRGFLIREEVPEKGNATGRVLYRYDSRGNVVEVDDAGTVVESVYDRVGRLLEVRSGSGRVLESRSYYPDVEGGRLETARRFNYFGLGETGGFAEDILGGNALLIFEVEDRFTYDNRGNVSSKETRVERVKEDLLGTEVERLALLGVRASWTYDGLGRVITLSHPECFTGGTLCQAVTAAGLHRLDLRNTYDLGELTFIEATDDAGPAPDYQPLLGFRYHPSGGLRRIDRYDLRGVLTGYDERLELIHRPADPSDPNSHPDLTLPRVGSISQRGPGGGLRWTTGAYGYDGQGRINALGARFHQYDRLNRLLTDGIHSYSYDDFDNLLSGDNPTLAFTVDAATNRLDTITLPGGAQPVTYDSRGNLSDAAGAHTRYDPFGRAKSWWWDFTAATPYDYQGLYIYGPDGSRVADLSRLPVADDPGVGIVDPEADPKDGLPGDGPLGSDFSEILFTFRGPDSSPLRELRWTDEVTATTSRSLAVGSRTYVGRDVVVAEGSDGTGDQPYSLRHITSDHLGTPRYARTYGGLTGAFLSANADDGYSPYGFNEEAVDSRIRESLAFAGHWNDRNAPDLALPRDGNPFTLNMGARSYLPDVGRFLSVDPGRDSSAWSLYAYAANDPVNLADSDGMKPRPVTSFSETIEVVARHPAKDPAVNVPEIQARLSAIADTAGPMVEGMENMLKIELLVMSGLGMASLNAVRIAGTKLVIGGPSSLEAGGAAALGNLLEQLRQNGWNPNELDPVNLAAAFAAGSLVPEVENRMVDEVAAFGLGMLVEQINSSDEDCSTESGPLSIECRQLRDQLIRSIRAAFKTESDP